jgi:biopolymer transport protein ExbB
MSKTLQHVVHFIASMPTAAKTLASPFSSPGKRLTRSAATRGAPAFSAFVSLFLVASGAFFALSTPAQAWWNDDWSMRKKITIDTSASGANITDPIGTQAILVRLHAGNFRFAQAKEDGSDLRFIASDDKTPLKFHIEGFDALLADAFVWVQVPELKSGAKTDFWLYYGNKKAVAAADAKGTYDAATQLVYHFNERGTPAQDATVWSNGAQSAGQPAEGAIIGTGLRLNGRTPITLPASPSLALPSAGSLSLSVWFKAAVLQPNAAIYSRHDGTNGLIIGLDNGAPFAEVINAGAVHRTPPGLPVAPGGWHHLAVTASPGFLTLYLDGKAVSTLAVTLPALNSIALLGGDTAVAVPAPVPAPAPAATPAPAAPAATANSPSPSSQGTTTAGQAGGGTASPPPAAAAAPAAAPAPAAQPAPAPVASALAGFAGDIDELEISNIARPAGYIRAQAIGQGTDPGKFIGFSVDEENASWFSGYFAVILKSVTIDGWVVIGILMIIAVISWTVMFERARYLGRQAKANGRFLDAFRDMGGDLAHLDAVSGEEVATLGGRLSGPVQRVIRNSSLYRLYLIAAAEIRDRFPDTERRAKGLTGPAVASIRAALDGALVREIQRLNRSMVILTIAISGGPFLGLLGTVVGVMITFAAIAASGDVNVNAIAPGIAAALVATVAGLGVAIPALFAYNYLISKVKDLTSDMQVFVDEVVTKLAEAYTPVGRPDPIQTRLAAE